MSKNWKKVASTPHPLALTAYPTPGKGYPIFFMKMTAKDVKEITFMPLVTFFSVLEQPGKTRKGVATTPPPPLVRRGLKFVDATIQFLKVWQCCDMEDPTEERPTYHLIKPIEIHRRNTERIRKKQLTGAIFVKPC